MKFEELLKLLNGEVIFPSSILLAGNVSKHVIRKQLTRWVSSGKLTQLRRGFYAIRSDPDKSFNLGIIVSELY